MRFLIAIIMIVILGAQPAFAHQHGDGDQTAHDDVTFEKLSDQVSMIQAGGGNIAVFAGKDSVFVIDNGLADKRDVVNRALKKVTNKPIKFLVNTHWHFDHAGNNDYFGQNDTIILAHENVRTRLKFGGEVKAFDAKIVPYPVSALPVITYQESIKLHLNDQDIEIIALHPAHTDGDSFIVFPQENVIHTGDIFFNGFWPFIDSSSGGSIKGVINAVEIILSKTKPSTTIIPGHGPVASKNDLEIYRDMLMEVEGRLKAAKQAGQTKEEWIKSNPFADLDATWGQGFLPTPKFTEIIWDSYK